MNTNTKTILFFTAGIALAGGITYFVLPKMVTRIESKIERHDDLANKSRKFFSQDQVGRAMLGTGIFIGGLGVATVGLHGLAYLASASNKFAGEFPSALKLK